MFQKDQNKIIGQLWVFQKIRIKKPIGFGYFKTFKE
jgi:hypothetical protein